MPILTKAMTPRLRKEIDTSTYTGRFAARLKALREKAGMSVEEVAAQLEISAVAIYHWEAANRQPKISDLPIIAEVLGVSKARLILPDE